MKRIIILLISVIFPCAIFAQVQTYEQKGIVRSQSFPGKDGTRIVGARITRAGKNVDPVCSLETPEKGYFALPMDNSEGSKVYYISSVEGPKGTQYKLMFPQPNDRLEYTPNAPLTIIMQSEKEMQDFINAATATMRRDLDRQLQDSVKVLDQLREKKKIQDAEYNQLYNKYYELCSDSKRLLEEYIKNIAQHDFESRASSQKEVDIAIALGNYKLAKSLLAQMGTIDEIINDIKNDSLKLKYLRIAESLTEDEIIRNKEKGIFICDRSIAAYLGSFENDSVWKYKIAKLRIEPFNVNFLCECGEFAEVYYNKYGDAKEFYLKALEQAKLQNLSKKIIAICHNHLGDVYNNLSEFALAEEHYSQARLILESSKGELPQEIYDSYLGLGNVSYPQAKFGEALKFYEKCSAPDVAFINRKAYWQGRIGVGRIKLAKGDYHGAKSDFAAILNEIVSIQNIDVVTLSQAYSSMIECMATIGQYQTAIDSCNAAIKIIKKHSSPKNTYIADLLVQKGNAYINIGKIREGEQCMNDAIEIYKNILGENHPNYASACVMFANYYILVGDLKKSEEMSSKALALLETKFGKNHLTTVAAHTSRCQLYQTYAEFDKAQAELDTIKTIWKSSGLFNDYNQIQLNTNEAGLKIAQGELPKGVKIYQEAVDCVIRTLGNESVQLIDLYRKMAIAYLMQHENAKAKKYLDKVQSLANAIYGNDSPLSVLQQIEMGQYYLNQGDAHMAYGVYSKIERILVDLFGEDSYLLCKTYNMLGDYYLNQYHFKKAYYYYDKLYEIVKTTFGEEHYYIAEPIAKIGAFFMKTGDFNKGLEKEEQAYKLLSDHFEVGHKATLQSQLGICSAYIQLGQFDKAELVLTDLSKAVEKKLGKKHPMYSNVLQIKATLHHIKGEYNKGIECLEEAIRITESIYGQHHSNTMDLYGQLSEMQFTMCNIHKAVDYNDIAIAIAKSFYGKNNVGVMPFLLRKGSLCANLSRIGEAHQIYDKVKKTYANHFGGSCKQLNKVLIAEAQLLMLEGYGERALEILKNVETQMSLIYGDNSIRMCDIYNSLAGAYQNVLQYEKAKDYYRKSLDLIKKSLGEFNVNYISPLVGLGNVCILEDATGQHIGDASRFFKKASFISSSVYGSNNLNSAIIDAIIGEVSLRQGNLQDAYNKFQKYAKSVIHSFGENVGANTYDAKVHMCWGNYYVEKAKETSWKQDSLNSRRYVLQAKDEFEKAEIISEMIFGKEHVGIVNSLSGIAQTYFLLQHLDSAIAVYNKVAELTIKQYGKQSPLVAQIYATLADAIYSDYEREQNTLKDEGKLNNAKDFFIKAITLRKNSKGNSREFLMASTMDWRIKLSTIYFKLNDFENSFRTIDEIIHDLESLRLENKYALYNCYYKKAKMILDCQRDANVALDLLLKANALFSHLSFPNNLIKEMTYSQLLFSFGVAYEKTGEKEKAISNYEDAYTIFKKNPYIPEVVKQALRDKVGGLKNE